MMTDDTSNVPRYPWAVRNHIVMARTADEMARQCRELDDPPRPRDDAPDFRRIGFRRRERVREEIRDD